MTIQHIFVLIFSYKRKQILSKAIIHPSSDMPSPSAHESPPAGNTKHLLLCCLYAFASASVPTRSLAWMNVFNWNIWCLLIGNQQCGRESWRTQWSRQSSQDTGCRRVTHQWPRLRPQLSTVRKWKNRNNIIQKKKGWAWHFKVQNQCAHILCWPLSSHLLVLYRSSQFPSFITTRPRTLLWSLLRLTSPLFSPTNLSLECMEMPQTEQLLEWHPAWPSGVKD